MKYIFVLGFSVVDDKDFEQSSGTLGRFVHHSTFNNDPNILTSSVLNSVNNTNSNSNGSSRLPHDSGAQSSQSQQSMVNKETTKDC